VLDGCPKNYVEAKGVFTWVPKKKKKPKKEEKPKKAEGEEGAEGAEGEDAPAEEEEPPAEEEDGEDKPKARFFKEIYPDAVVLLQGDDDFLKKKA
jgi:adenylate kinase